MLPGARERFIEIPEGIPGSLMTLNRMGAMIRAQDAVVDHFVSGLLDLADMQNLEPRQLAALVFEWVRSRMLYLPDRGDNDLIEEIRTPGYLLQEIDRYTNAVGDCDDYVVLYGAIYSRLGWPVTLVAVSTHDDKLLDHVYLAIGRDVERISVDGIVGDPFGWEVPETEITNKVQVPV
jgi:hypothetical protein